MDTLQQQMADNERSAAAERAADGEFYGRTAVDYQLHAADLAEFAANGWTVCPECGGWGYCGRCNDNGYLLADGTPAPGWWESEPWWDAVTGQVIPLSEEE